MKRINLIFILNLFTIAILLYSCGGDKKNTAADNQLGKIDVEIPESLKDKPEVVTYIHEMNKIADDYAILIDQVLSDFSDFENKDIEKMGVMDKIKFMKVSTEVGLKSLDMVSKWGVYHNRLDVFKEGFSDVENVALESVMKRFEERMDQIPKKHSKFFMEDQ